MQELGIGDGLNGEGMVYDDFEIPNEKDTP